MRRPSDPVPTLENSVQEFALEPHPVYDSPGDEMSRQTASVLYVVVMAAVIVGVDVAFFRGRLWERLIANIGIVLVFAAFYLRFLKRP